MDFSLLSLLSNELSVFRNTVQMSCSDAEAFTPFKSNDLDQVAEYSSAIRQTFLRQMVQK